jgi:hypothetical protein
MWVAKNLERMGPPSESLALLVAKEFRAWRDYDLATKLAALPQSALTAAVLREALAMSHSVDVLPVLAAADVDTLLRALTDGIGEAPDWVPSLDACVALASRKADPLHAPLLEIATRYEESDPETARAVRAALSG